MPVKTVTSPRSAPQGTFRQATRGVSFLVHAYLHFSTPCLVKLADMWLARLLS